MSNKTLKERYGLPDSIRVEIHKGKLGQYYASLPDYPGCITIAKNIGELIESVTDAVLTYFEVPRKEAIKSEIIYLPHVKKEEIKGATKEFISVSQAYFYA